MTTNAARVEHVPRSDTWPVRNFGGAQSAPSLKLTTARRLETIF